MADSSERPGDPALPNRREIARLRSERLFAEPLGVAHLEDLRRMHQDPRVMATLGGVRDDAQTRQIVDESIAHWDRHGFGLWALREKPGGSFAGRGGLRHVVVGGHREIELAYAFMPEHWGRGLATEIARRMLDLARDTLRIEEVVAFTLPENRASQRVLSKVGMHYERDVVHAGLPHVLYRAALARDAKSGGAAA